MIKCSNCGGHAEKIERAGEAVFWFCRPCKLPHDQHSNPLFVNGLPADKYSAVSHAQKIAEAHTKGMSPVGKVSVTMSLIQPLQEAYFAGMKDGVLLAYSQDIKEGEPMMEKVGVSKEELKKELTDKYNSLKEKQLNDMSKEAAASVQSELTAVKQKIDELDAEA